VTDQQQQTTQDQHEPPASTGEPTDQTAATSPVGKPSEEEKPDGRATALNAERKARREAERRLRDAEDRLAQTERAAARESIAAELNLTPEQAEFVTGEDEDEMRQNAEKLAAAFGGRSDDDARRRPREVLRSGATSAQEATSMRDIADRIMGG
jgi:hypothetical protein